MRTILLPFAPLVRKWDSSRSKIFLFFFFSSFHAHFFCFQEYAPEFKPTVASATSTENIDIAFLEEEAADSHVPDSALTGAADEFDGFTFVDEGAIKK